MQSRARLPPLQFSAQKNFSGGIPMNFTQKPTAIIWAKDSDGEFHSVFGVTTAQTTDVNAAAQLNKIFAIIGKTIVTDDMQRIITEEAN